MMKFFPYHLPNVANKFSNTLYERIQSIPGRLDVISQMLHALDCPAFILPY